MEDVRAENDKGLPALRGVYLQVRQGEIVGLAGVAGNGQRELAEVITGLRKCDKGRVVVSGEDITNQPVRSGIQRGVAHIPEDRTHVGTAPNLSVTDNVIMKNYNQRADCARLDVRMRLAASSFAEELKESLRYHRPQRSRPRCACFRVATCSG